MRKSLLSGLVALSACGGGADARTGGAERDSAGITIVEHAALPATELTVAPEPVLRIGAAEGAEAYQLHNVQALARFPDGRLAVAHANHVVNIYDAGGRYVQTVGREGSGPGEFRRVTYMRRLNGDSLLVYDAVARRVTIYGPDLAATRDIPLVLLNSRIPTVVGALPDGALLIRRALGQPPAAGGATRDTLEFALLRADSLIALRTYPGPEMNIAIAERGGRIMSMSITQVPFARPAHAAAAGERFITATGEAFEVHIWRPDGGLDRIVRSAHVQPRQVTPELFEQYVEYELARRAERSGADFDAAEARRQIEALPRAETVPILASLVGAGDGSFWVREYSVSDDGRWIVFGADGSVRGVLRLPAQFRPFLVEDSVVFGVERDELDVESVRAYRIDG